MKSASSWKDNVAHSGRTSGSTKSPHESQREQSEFQGKSFRYIRREEPEPPPESTFTLNIDNLNLMLYMHPLSLYTDILRQYDKPFQRQLDGLTMELDRHPGSMSSPFEGRPGTILCPPALPSNRAQPVAPFSPLRASTQHLQENNHSDYDNFRAKPRFCEHIGSMEDRMQVTRLERT